MKKTFIVVSLLLPAVSFAQQDLATDSLSTRLEEVVVQGSRQQLGAEVSTYVPTSKQKNSAQTAVDLLNRMAIPQLKVSPNYVVTDMAGKSVDIFIDFLPALKEDLVGMRLQDVKKIEYYDYPSNPRFQGKAHVVNFIMQKYEYGGYVKTYGWENTSNAGQISLYSKVQYKRIMIDLAAGAFYLNQSHTGGDVYETFRLPQPDGSLSVFERNFIQDSGKLRKRTYWPTFKVLYSTDKITIQNMVGASFDHTPFNDVMGHISYSPEISPAAAVSDCKANRVNTLSYKGYWNFILNDRNSITFSPHFTYSHTNTMSRYAEDNTDEFENSAIDNSYQLSGDLAYSHSFGEWGRLNTMVKALITRNRTTYSGTTNTSDRVNNYRMGPGVQYSISKGKIYGMLGIGLNYNRLECLDYKEISSSPWFDFSLQYSPSDRHSIRGDYHYFKIMPSSSYRSAAVIQSNPLMSYTGNPDIRSEGSYNAGASYTFIPANRFSITAFADTWILANRFVYEYVPYATGLLRIIRQPGGGYSQWNYGFAGTLRLFDRSLQLTAQMSANSVRNGEPYNFNRTKLGYAFQASYYLDHWTFSGLYYSSQGYSDGSMVGTWMMTRPYYNIQIGWANSTWNFQLQVASLARWHWRSDRSEMRSRYYDKAEQTYSINDHALARLAVTYTLGFGKKVKRGDEATQLSGIESGILK